MIEHLNMRVTCHWRDSNWVLHKRLIALNEMHGAHMIQNVYSTISTILDEYLLTQKKKNSHRI